MAGRGIQGGKAFPVAIVNTEVDGLPVSGAPRTRIQPYKNIRTGELISSTASGTGSKQGPDIACDMVKFIAHVSNGGNINLGWNAGVTVTDGTADTSTGLILAPGKDSGWIPVANVNLIFYIGTTAGDKLTYMAMVD